MLSIVFMYLPLASTARPRRLLASAEEASRRAAMQRVERVRIIFIFFFLWGKELVLLFVVVVLACCASFWLFWFWLAVCVCVWLNERRGKGSVRERMHVQI